MKKSGIFALGLALALAGSFSACDNGADNAKQPSTAAKEKKDSLTNLPNYRYVDLDTLLSRYNLAKDYNEEMVRMQANADNTMKRHENSIQAQANQMQNKQRNNGYLTQESMQQDQNRLLSLQNNAQKEMQTLQGNMEKAAIQAQQAVNDSIQTFIKEYNSKHGYDAIFIKNATLYINPALDITDDVVEGLNARYNKVKK